MKDFILREASLFQTRVVNKIDHFSQGCRRCEDCGSNTPGGGPTSRWHHNFSVCDSCYQQRNKGLFCPLCGRAYRQFTDVAMVQCLSCEKWVHASCDNIDKDEYQKYNSKDLPYFCPTCKPKKGSLQLLVSSCSF